MPKKSQSNSLGKVKQETSVGSRIFEALTEGEISQLLDELFAVLSDEQRVTVFAQLQGNTQETLTQIIAPPQTVEQVKASKAQPTSLAKLAQKIRELDEEFYHTSLDDDAVTDFFSHLPDVEKKLIFDGLTANREVSLWKHDLENTFSYWHIVYMELMQQFATPEIYLNNLRATISQEWQNGLPVIEDLLAKQEYRGI